MNFSPITEVSENKMESIPISELKPDPRNLNRHTERGSSFVKKSLESFGFGRSILVDKDGYIIAGNLTAEEAGQIGIEDVIIVPSDGSKIIAVQRTDIEIDSPKGRGLALADNRSSEVSLEWKTEELILMDSEELIELDEWFLPNEINVLKGGAQESKDAEPMEPSHELLKKWGVVYGDLWQIGGHRLLCGDSTNADDVGKVMAGELAVLLQTDAPYGIGYVKNAQSKGQSVGHTDIENDDLDGEKLQRFLEDCIKSALPFLTENCAFYLWHPMLTQGTFFAAAAAAAADILINRQIIWCKPSLVFGRGDYHWQHELCFYGWRRGHKPPFYGERNQTTLWHIGREKEKYHPTAKPPELWNPPILNHTLDREVVYEPFSGSGSQMVAAQNLGRKCYGIEIEPKYCAVILERMHTAFPELIIKRLS